MGRPFLWIALDNLTTSRAAEVTTLNVVSHLNLLSDDFGYKVNLDWVLRVGWREVRLARIHQFADRPLFADLKSWNGARTMTQVFVDAHNAGVSAVNAHALAGGYLAKGAELLEAVIGFRQSVVKTQLSIYAVTLLTHYDDLYSRRQFGKSFSEKVRELADEAVAADADGIIMPGTMLSAVTHLASKRKILPGFRTDSYQDVRHRQEIFAKDIAGRTDIEVVCGGPIMNAADPVKELKSILGSLEG